jgi:hypothetical protein
MGRPLSDSLRCSSTIGFACPWHRLRSLAIDQRWSSPSGISPACRSARRAAWAKGFMGNQSGARTLHRPPAACSGHGFVGFLWIDRRDCSGYRHTAPRSPSTAGSYPPTIELRLTETSRPFSPLGTALPPFRPFHMSPWLMSCMLDVAHHAKVSL